MVYQYRFCTFQDEGAIGVNMAKKKREEMLIGATAKSKNKKKSLMGNELIPRPMMPPAWATENNSSFIEYFAPKAIILRPPPSSEEVIPEESPQEISLWESVLSPMAVVESVPEEIITVSTENDDILEPPVLHILEDVDEPPILVPMEAVEAPLEEPLEAVLAGPIPEIEIQIRSRDWRIVHLSEPSGWSRLQTFKSIIEGNVSEELLREAGVYAEDMRMILRQYIGGDMRGRPVFRLFRDIETMEGMIWGNILFRFDPFIRKTPPLAVSFYHHMSGRRKYFNNLGLI